MTIELIIAKHGGEIGGGINWTWARFADDMIGKKCFEECLKVFPDMDHRGYYEANPDACNPNLHRGGFRYR